MWHRVVAEVLDILPVGKDTYRMRLSAPELVRDARSGQFVEVLCGGVSLPYLRRPISIHSLDKQCGVLGLLFRVVGSGTEYMASLRAGDNVDLLGPLGNGWPDVSAKNVLMLAGGIGIAPMPEAAKTYKAAGADVRFLYGARSEDELVALDALEDSGIQPVLATDDGSRGYEGFVTDLLPQQIEALGDAVVMACGPTPMLRVAQRICRDMGAVLYVSLEQKMACGVGACLGCVVETVHRSPRYVKVCADGPVFRADEVVIGDV